MTSTCLGVSRYFKKHDDYLSDVDKIKKMRAHLLVSAILSNKNAKEQLCNKTHTNRNCSPILLQFLIWRINYRPLLYGAPSTEKISLVCKTVKAERKTERETLTMRVNLNLHNSNGCFVELSV